MEIKLESGVIVVDRTSQDQSWRERLVLVASPPTRYLGILPPEEEEAALAGRPFWLYASAMYFCNIAVSAGQNGSANVGTMPQALLGYDLLSPVNRTRICAPQHWFFLHEQPTKLKTFFTESYLNAFDPSRVVKPGEDR
jgi:hypothetical protein